MSRGKRAGNLAYRLLEPPVGDVREITGDPQHHSIALGHLNAVLAKPFEAAEVVRQVTTALRVPVGSR